MEDLKEMKEQQYFSSLKSQKKFFFEFSQNAATVVWFWLRIKMETQKMAKLLGDADNESSKFATKKWYVINNQNNTNYGKGDENSTTVKFKLKSLNQTFVIIQTHIFL